VLVEWFVGFVLSVVGGMLDWLPASDEIEMPDLGPIFGIMRTFDAVIPVQPWFDVLAVLGVVLSVVFMFALIRQVWKFVPIIGGG